MAFAERLLELIQRDGITNYRLSKLAGCSATTVANWLAGKEVTQTYLQKLSEIFSVSTDYLLTGEDKENAPFLSKKDERDVARNVERMMDDLEHSGDLMFDGVPMSEEAKVAMAAAMRVGLEEAKRRNKATYTPKKYRRE